MNINIKLNNAYGVLTPDSVTLADNEGVVFTVPFENGALLLNGKLFVQKDGVITIPRDDLKENNVCEWVKTENGAIVRKWRLNGFCVEKVDGVTQYFDELTLYKNKFRSLRIEVDRLKEFRKNATTDIENLVNAVNSLSEAFKAVKEEMSL